MISWFRPQNQVGFTLSVAPQNRWREVGAGVSLARVSQSGLKIGRGATMGDACGTIVEVASEAS
jgi:hypothetical protein